MQIHNSPRSCSRNWLASFAVFPLILFLATRNISDAMFFFGGLTLVLLPIWIRLGRVAKSIEVTSEGLDIKCYNNAIMHIAWTDLIRTETRPYKTFAGFSYVYIYSKTAKPIPFCDSISGYHDLLAKIRQHGSGHGEGEPPASVKRPIEHGHGIGPFMLLVGPLLATALAIASAGIWSWWPTLAIVLLLGTFSIPLIYAAALRPITANSAALRVLARKAVVADTAFFAIVFALVAARSLACSRPLAAVLLLAAAFSCVIGTLTLRKLSLS